MKKIISIAVVALLLVSVFSMTAYAAEPNILWDFGEGSDIEDFMGSPTTLDWYAEGDYHVFTASGNDPNVPINISADDVSQVVWAKARVKNPSPATAIELFGATNGRSLTGSECTHIDIQSNSNEWLTYIIYIPDENVKTVNAYKDPQYAITEPYWEGTVEFIRLDPMWQEGDDGSDAGGNMASGDQIYIDYIAFFATEEDAKAFREEPAPVVAEEVVEVAASEDVAPVTETVAAPAPVKAPQTSDMATIAIVFMLISAAAIVVLKKRKA